MSRHSKFANIKHKKEKNDAAKGKIFTMIGREIAVAVKEGGPDPANNFKLAQVIAKAKSNNMPNDTIERGIKKAAGDGSGVPLVRGFSAPPVRRCGGVRVGHGGAAAEQRCRPHRKDHLAHSHHPDAGVRQPVLPVRPDGGGPPGRQAAAAAAHRPDPGRHPPGTGGGGAAAG